MSGMTILNLEPELEVSASAVRLTDDDLIVELEDGRTITTPLSWFPRLRYGKKQHRERFELSHYGIHWPELDEDINFRGLLLGRQSGESAASLKFWLDNYKKGKKVTLMDFSRHRKAKKRK